MSWRSLSGLLVLCLILMGCKPEPPVRIEEPDVPCWGGQRLGTHGRREFFCEANRRSCVAQPANTWSNFGYLAVAAVGWSSTRRRERTLAARVFGLLVVLESAYLGVSSGLFHASITHWAERLDLSGTYGVLLALFGYATAILLGPRRKDVVYGVLTICLAVQTLVTIFKYRMHDFVVFPIVLIALTASQVELVRRRLIPGRHMLLALASILAGITVWGLDLAHIGCSPNAVLQGHAAWHVLTASAVFFAFLAMERGLEEAQGSSVSVPNASGT